jgi:hypothetical protein
MLQSLTHGRDALLPFGLTETVLLTAFVPHTLGSRQKAGKLAFPIA